MQIVSTQVNLNSDLAKHCTFLKYLHRYTQSLTFLKKFLMKYHLWAADMKPHAFFQRNSPLNITKRVQEHLIHFWQSNPLFTYQHLFCDKMIAQMQGTVNKSNTWIFKSLIWWSKSPPAVSPLPWGAIYKRFCHLSCNVAQLHFQLRQQLMIQHFNLSAFKKARQNPHLICLDY